MQNFILINRTFTEVTPESAENGDFSDSGFLAENEAVTFRELVELMRIHREPSNSGKISTNTWFSTYPEITDYSTCTETTESIHFCAENAENVAKYWALARKFADKNSK